MSRRLTAALVAVACCLPPCGCGKNSNDTAPADKILPGVDIDSVVREVNSFTDELEKTFHYRHWRQDLHLVRDMGIRFLRYGPPYYRINTAPDSYDWEFTDLVFAEIKDAFENYGRGGLAPQPRRRPRMPNETPPELERQILVMTREYPTYSYMKIADQLS